MCPSEAPWLSELDIPSHLGGWTWHFKDNCVEAHQDIFDLFQICDSLDDHHLTKWFERVHPSDRHSFGKSFKKFLCRGSQIDTSFRLTCDEGGDRWLQILGQIKRSENGEPLCASGVLIDVTYQQELAKETISELFERQHSISYNLTDELGQQLAGILIRTEMVKEVLEKDAPQTNHQLDEIIESLRSAQIFTRQLAHKALPALVSTDELTQKLEELTSVSADRFDTTCIFRMTGEARALDSFEASQVYLMAEDGINLLLDESSIQRVQLSLRMGESKTILEFRLVDQPFKDISLQSIPRFSKLKKRAKLLGGGVSIRYQEPAFIRCTF